MRAGSHSLHTECHESTGLGMCWHAACGAICSVSVTQGDTAGEIALAALCAALGRSRLLLARPGCASLDVQRANTLCWNHGELNGRWEQEQCWVMLGCNLPGLDMRNTLLCVLLDPYGSYERWHAGCRGTVCDAKLASATFNVVCTKQCRCSDLVSGLALSTAQLGRARLTSSRRRVCCCSHFWCIRLRAWLLQRHA